MVFNKKMNLMVVFLIICVGTVFAQGQMQQQPTEAQQLYQEFNMLSQQLQQIQQQAMSDETLAAKGEALDKKIEEAMIANNPGIKETLDKRDQIISQYQTAQQSGDQAALAQLGQQFQAISQTIQAEQQKAMRNPDLQSSYMEFETMLKTKMEEINPQTPQILSRAEEIRNKLMTMQQQGQN